MSDHLFLCSNKSLAKSNWPCHCIRIFFCDLQRGRHVLPTQCRLNNYARFECNFQAGEMIDRLYPWCQGDIPLLTKAKIREQQELNYTFAKTSAKRTGSMMNEKMMRTQGESHRSTETIGGTDLKYICWHTHARTCPQTYIDKSI